MPFPWKKAKVSRFSRLVADLHQSPKRGGSLVVETGFPTSLVDLFVKNRDRLRKRKPSSQIRTPRTTHQPPPSPLQSSPSPPCNEELQTPLVYCEEAETATIACHAAFKFFLVVALAFSVRNLVLWIMMVAFLLVVVEFVGTRFFSFWDCWVRKGLLVLNKWDRKRQGSPSAAAAEELVVKQEASVSPDSGELIESESDCESLKTETKVETTSIREMLTCETERSSRRPRIKTSFIKKFVPKKMRHGKKQGKSSIIIAESCS